MHNKNNSITTEVNNGFGKFSLNHLTKAIVVSSSLILMSCGGGSSSPSENTGELTTPTPTPTPTPENDDGDNDGVVNSIDQCLETLVGNVNYIDETGCDNGEFTYYVTAINSGGEDYVSDSGIVYIADSKFIGGSGFSYIKGFDATKDDVLYQSERYGDFTYNIPVPNGDYSVMLQTAEGYHTDVGKRVMNILLEGESLKTSFDIIEAVDTVNTAYDFSHDISISDGGINIEFDTVTDNAKVSAVVITTRLKRDQDVDNDGVNNIDDLCAFTEAAEINNINLEGCAPSELPPEPVPTGGKTFVEEGGLLVVEMESTNYTDGWKLETGRGETGTGYLNMLGKQAAWVPANITEVIKVKIEIQTAGMYQFEWRSLITKPGVPATEHNDSYLKIIADKFYGVKGSNIVCPLVLEDGNSCIPSGRALAGEKVGGYFKIWRTGSPIDAWKWSTWTSDADGHAVMAEFDAAGVYEVHIANRSDYHAIDRFVLYRTGNVSNNVARETALDISTPESLSK